MNRHSLHLAVLAAALAAAPAFADEFIDLRPLVREVAAASPGAETIIPFMVLRDTNADGNPDLFYIEYRVYKGGTTTFLHKSTGKSVNYPAAACANPDYVEANFDNIKFLGNPGSTRIHTAVSLNTNCSEAGNYKERYVTFLHSADLAVANNAGWSYQVARELIALDFVDTNNDGTFEVALHTGQLLVPDNYDAGENLVIRMMNATTGTGLSEIAYPLVRP